MNNEIKEILDILEGRKNWYLHQQKNNSPFNDEEYIAYMVLDYITNLQEELEEEKRIEEESLKTIQNLEEENERLKEDLQQEKKDFKEANDYCFELKDYKSRICKAIPMLKDLNIKLKDILKIGIDIKEISDIESLLQGSDKE